jgi:four helix bundle protein
VVLKSFRSYHQSVAFFKSCRKVKGSLHLNDQLLRAASSITLNLAEGSERGTDPDQRRFFRMAMGSIRECQAILDLLGEGTALNEVKAEADLLAASVFNLCRALDSKVKSAKKT